MKQEIVKGAQLTAINVCKMKRTGNETLTIGEVYEVLGVNNNEDEFWIKDDFDEQHFFGISDYTDYFESLLKPNNGWIKIEREQDLPKENGDYWVVWNGKIIIQYWYSSDNPHADIQKQNSDWMKIVTHYQPIEQPKHPLY